MNNKDFDKNFNRVFKGAIVGIVISAVVGLGLLGLVVWAIISLVTHFTA